MLKSRISILLILLAITILITWTPSYGQLPELEFEQFELSDTVVIGGTLTITGVLKNTGTEPISAELALRMTTGTVDSPPAAYSNTYYENNFNNSVIAPQESQPFVRLIEVTEEWFDINENSNLQGNESTTITKSAAGGGRIIVVIWPRGNEAELQHEENAPQLKSGFGSMSVYTDSIVVLQPDEALESKSYDSNPAILKGKDLADTPLEGAMPDDIVGFRYKNDEWVQIPVQIDEMKWVNPYSVYNLSQTVDADEYIKVYADPETYAGADNDATFDDDDELVFMLKDAGNPVNLDDIELPEGVVPNTGVEISIQNAKLKKDTYVYLFNQDGSLEQDADISYVTYNFSLLSGNYFLLYNKNYSNPENTSVIGDNYTLNFSDTWKMDDMHITAEESSGIDILTGHSTYFLSNLLANFDFSYRCFVTNKQGPIRGIRSYMRGETFEPLSIQKTHFFYAKRHDVFTNLRGEYPDSPIFDILNIAVNQQQMNYQSNIDVTPLLLDDGEDPLCTALYNNVPLEWELVEGQQGSLGIIHQILMNDTWDDNSNLLNGYWSDGGIDSYPGLDGWNLGHEQDGQYAKSNSDSGIGMWAPMDDSEDTYSDVEYRRYTYFDDPGMSVEAVNARSTSIRQPPVIEQTSNKYYDVQISAYLEGPFESSNITMDNSLNAVHQLLPGQPLSNNPSPIVTPYSAAPWNYTGTECDTFMTKEYPTDVVDLLLVSFRTEPEPTSEVAKTLALLKKDGTIELLNDKMLSRKDGDNFYMVIEHRNHIGIMTPIPVEVVNYELRYDFRTQNSFTNNGVRYGQKEVVPGIWAMYSGEASQSVIGYDINGEDKAKWSLSNGIFSIYADTDFNLDGTIDGEDKGLWFSNNGISGALMR